jgi:hypothetical protein
MSVRVQLAAVTLGIAAACTATKPSPPPELPTDYTTTFTKVRNCLPSIEHGLVNVVVYASPSAVPTYTTLTGTYATGAMLVKEEYADSDNSCASPIQDWTVAEKLTAGSSPGTLDWHWQKINSGRTTIEDNDQTCISCHSMCTPTGEEGGYLYTCSAPGSTGSGSGSGS